jgi:Tol biopolymer transport system component
LDAFTSGTRIGEGNRVAISADGGFIAFESALTDLDATVAANPDVSWRIFVQDRGAGTTEQVSINQNGGDADGISFSPSISGDGRFVAFHSSARNLVPAELVGGGSNIYVFDRAEQRMMLASTHSDGTQQDLNGTSLHPKIAADGRWVAFVSTATNLVDDDTNGLFDVFVHDLESGATVRVSPDERGGLVHGEIERDSASISQDGRFVAYQGAGGDFPLNEALRLRPPILVHDRNLDGNGVFGEACEGCRVTHRIDLDATGQPIGGALPSLSANGRNFSFYAPADNDESQSDRFRLEVVIIDRDADGNCIMDEVCTGCRGVGRVARGPSNAELFYVAEEFRAPSISRDGRYVAFTTTTRRTFPGTGERFWDFDVLIYDARDVRVWQASVDDAPPYRTAQEFGSLPVGVKSQHGVMSDDGEWLAYVANGFIYVEPLQSMR